MTYSAEDSARLKREAHAIAGQLARLQDDMLLGAWYQLTRPESSVYLKEGVCRRLGIMRHSTERIFEIFSPELSTVLKRGDRMDVQAFLHAFVMNVYGALDNLAWVFVLERALMPTIGDRRRVGLFHPGDSNPFASASSQLSFISEIDRVVQSLRKVYAKNYREDALAHRLPPYIPPFILLEANEPRYREIERTMNAALLAGDVGKCEMLEKEQDALTLPAAHFLLSMTDDDGRQPLQLQPQLIVDAMTLHDLARRLGADFSVGP